MTISEHGFSRCCPAMHYPQVVSNNGTGGLVPLPQNADWVSGNVTLPQEGLSSFDFVYYVSHCCNVTHAACMQAWGLAFVHHLSCCL
jgi:hypothetical protein